MRKSSKVKALAVACLVALLVVVRSEVIAKEDLDAESAWTESYKTLYGSSLPEFYVLGDGSFQASWLPDSEDALRPCMQNQRCVWLRVASNQTCPISGKVKFNILDGEDRILATQESDSFIVLPGEMLVIELGSKKLDKTGFVEPIDAFCSETLPAV